jgi:hypothetical protein
MRHQVHIGSSDGPFLPVAHTTHRRWEAGQLPRALRLAVHEARGDAEVRLRLRGRRIGVIPGPDVGPVPTVLPLAEVPPVQTRAGTVDTCRHPERSQLGINDGISTWHSPGSSRPPYNKIMLYNKTRQGRDPLPDPNPATATAARSRGRGVGLMSPTASNGRASGSLPIAGRRNGWALGARSRSPAGPGPRRGNEADADACWCSSRAGAIRRAHS